MRGLREAIKNTQAMVGSLSNSFGRWGEAQFKCRLWEKMNPLGYNFGTGSEGPRKFHQNGKIIVECDDFLENGEYVCAVEVKNNVTKEKIDKHIDRIEKIRKWMDGRGDKRVLIGAVAGVVWEDSPAQVAEDYAFSKGLYVLTQANENVEAVTPPAGWEARKW